MIVLFACPKCDRTSAASVGQDDASFQCSHCEQVHAIPDDALRSDEEGNIRVERCIVCPSREMYVRKNFSQRLGITIIVLGIIASTITWSQHMVIATFGIFFASALLDVVLYMLVGNMLQCYRCHAEYRGVTGLDGHAGFSLETHERYRQQAARLAESEDA